MVRRFPASGKYLRDDPHKFLCSRLFLTTTFSFGNSVQNQHHMITSNEEYHYQNYVYKYEAIKKIEKKYVGKSELVD
jgi:hypothetical protein